METSGMARLEFSLEHHQPMDVAQARFEAGIDEAVSRYRSWVDQVDWSEDGQAATISGSGYEVRLWYDERFLHVRGRIPLAWKLFEGAVRHRIREMILRPA
jgi:hypothetical protein